jgi:hypothetical protein
MFFAPEAQGLVFAANPGISPFASIDRIGDRVT